MLTIIIPFYNTSKKIYPCLNFISQLDKNFFEVLFINDGSIDDTEEIINNYLLNKSSSINFKIINKENGGVSSARNLGIQHANNKYVMFLDADDTINRCFPSILREIVNDLEFEMMIFNYQSILPSDANSFHEKNLNKACIKLTEINHQSFIDDYISGNYINKIHVCSIIFDRKKILEHTILFQENLAYGEDQLFLITCLSKMNFYYIDIPILGYIKDTEFSAMGKVSDKRLKIIDLYNQFKNLTQKNDVKNKLRDRIDFELLIISKINFKHLNIFNSFIFFKKSIYPKVKNGNYGKNNKEFKMLLNAPFIYIMTYKLYRFFTK
ncbi:glycosyltransferase family 2 protein [Providencia rettgeri]|uniref:glycosyltransferase family 2 protein n=4 Tax=Morganellaceae TaxID=1903414 RepID=UPI00141A42E5|nr:glycosyltransferase family 2 protein [Providencia rettgeri]ELR5033705.1 glycosyltransferase family 2 protein [Providencia rettgeri]ELR5160344.1 glycosyltransferase family 2 protein [Providencia rettgeri]ELR5209860.1 glycosyltransferase family 2 protein [Providencia rettgeri]ELR5249630.1 glycosyltransferase family 2 protein [Providencia rettgeri]MCB4826233.1 glycosyltransferase family 2 protein [Providencia rettgeri]